MLNNAITAFLFWDKSKEIIMQTWMKKILSIINSFREQLHLHSLKNHIRAQKWQNYSGGRSDSYYPRWKKCRDIAVFALSVTKKFGLP